MKTMLALERFLLSAICILVLASCSQEVTQTTEEARPVKVEEINYANWQSGESFIGNVRAHQRTELGFESGGKVTAILVDIGDQVRAGQVLARLDIAPAKARLTRAEAERSAAVAALSERETQLQRIRELERDQVVSRAVLDGVKVQQQAAQSQLQAADAAITLAKRELELTQIKAPFDGRIVARSIQPQTDVAPGQAFLQLEAKGNMEVVLSLPEAVASRIKPGQVVNVQPAGQKPLPAHLDKISSRADNGSQIQAVFLIDGDTRGLYSGSTVSVLLHADDKQSLSIPASAFLPGQKEGEGQVFVLDKAAQKISLRQVKTGNTMAANSRFPLVSGIKPGEWVVVAGVTFLTDGQKAIPFISETQLKDAQP